MIRTASRHRSISPRRRARVGLALLLALGLGLPAAAQDASYRLGPGDRINFSVYGQTELTGDYTVGGGGNLFLPLIGEVAVGGLTLPEAQGRVVARLADGFLQQPVVTLRVSEMRPFYVLGDVRAPGSFPFRYGASVLSGIALAGGFAEPQQVQLGQRTDFLAADERVRVLEANRRLLTVRRARLEAQRRDKDAFEPPPGTDTDPRMAAALAEEREILKGQRAALDQSLDLLRAQKPRLESEITGVQAQRASEETQLRLIQAHMEDYEKLMASGLARRYQGIEFAREEARNKAAIARLGADLARLDLAIGDLALRIQETVEAYRRRVMSDLQDVTTRLNEIETQLPSAREIREARLQAGGALGTQAQGSLARKVFITRGRDGTPETFEADERAALMPGDIVEVRRELPARAGQAGLEPAGQVAAAETR
ncbi:polysaccharide biosynthesis/export family protein [Methylobacterium radiodurans]|uniref:Polysaccharide export protein n=1 Tax=Methylobacterium radiodurans TaxID=2202828 RepID=A0A2U8VWP4_9HYPH|nr:polysaccharide biosynthesis/export family protein [Methylobacterium radiodurans]AWN38223.1 polysaccharide export protein [Methylobacterium radiodurans]